ncbi:Oligosaccharide translocation protein rft1 [Saitoella coloradoensis]
MSGPTHKTINIKDRPVARESNAAPLPSSGSVLAATAQGAKYLIFLQFFSRILTFGMNQLVLRYTSPEVFGIATVQLELLMITVLFLSREGFRNTLQRIGGSPLAKPAMSGSGQVHDGTPEGDVQRVINLAYIPLPLGSSLAFLAACLYPRPSGLAPPYFTLSISIYCISTVIELLSEPCFALAQYRTQFTIRAKSEAAAVLGRCLATFGVTLMATKLDHPVGALPFAVGQLTYAILLLGTYLLSTSLPPSALLPRPINRPGGGYFFYRPTLNLAATMTAQGVFKHVLTEGDRMLIAWLSTEYDQGVYALAVNYGSLLARILFQPIEESSRNLFGHLLGTSKITDDKDKEKDAAAARDQAKSMLLTTLRLYSLLSLLLLTLGSSYAPIALRLLIGRRWSSSSSSAGDVLAAYCYYLPLMSINGIFEAFVASTATPGQLRTQSKWMVLFSALFVGSGWVFMRTLDMGAEGLVWANCVNLFGRIIWAFRYINIYFSRDGVDWREGVPSKGLLTAGVVVAAMARESARRWVGGEFGDLRHLGLGVVLGVGLLVCVIVSERGFLRQVGSTIRRR